MTGSAGAPAAPRGRAGACPSDESLAALVDGRVGGEDLVRLFAHLRRCPSCQEVYGGTLRDRRWEVARRVARSLRRAWRRLRVSLLRLLRRGPPGRRG